MILGRIIGKHTTKQVQFLVEGNAKNFEYVQLFHKEHGYVLGQIVELERDPDKTIARVNVIGYKDEQGRLKQIRSPFETDSEILIAEDEFIKKIIELDDDSGAYIGKLDGRDIPINLDLRNLLTKHIAVLAKSGAGKSYTVGVLLEEILEKRIPLLIIDPHGEYSSLQYDNDEESDQELMHAFGIQKKSYRDQIIEYGTSSRPIQLQNTLNPDELVHILPAKLSSAQMGLLFSVLKDLDDVDFASLIFGLENQESNAKWSIINVIDYLRKLKIFSKTATPYHELVQPGRCSILNLKGITPDVQEIIVYKILNDLFMMRKQNKVPPFFLVVEEAHNFAPERGFGETKASKILRTIASEGRKFGLGLCVVSQRPARIDKSVLSQCSTQLIMKVTNPNDVKAISSSVEGITLETETEIPNLPIGTCMLCGMTDMPLLVNVRPRRTKHGGQTVNILETEKDIVDQLDDFNEQDLLPIVLPSISKKDTLLMVEEGATLKTVLVPALIVTCKQKGFEFQLLFEMLSGNLLTDKDQKKVLALPSLDFLNEQENQLLNDYLNGRESEYLLLKQKGVLYSDGSNLVLHEKLKPMAELSHYAFYDKIEFSKIAYDELFEKKVDEKSVLKKISALCDVLDTTFSYLVYYEKA